MEYCTNMARAYNSKGMDANTLWRDTIDAAKMAEAKHAAIDTLVSEYCEHKGHRNVYGTDAWVALCNVVGAIFGESDGQTITDMVRWRLKGKKENAIEWDNLAITHNHWRVFHIETQLKALARERKQLLKERAVWNKAANKDK